MFDRIVEKKYVVFFILAAITLLARWLSFNFSVIDHDESTYIVIARDILNGKLLYTDMIDIKPPGIFYLFAGFLLIIKDGILSVRIFASLFIACSSFLIFLIVNRYSKSRFFSFFSAFTFILLTSAYRIGLPANTEIFFTFFTILFIYLLIRKNSSSLILLLAGMSIGTGFIIKYVVLFDFCAIMLIYLLYLIKNRTGIGKIISNILLITTGFLMPFVFAHLFFFISGNYNDFFYATFEVTRNYPTVLKASEICKYIIHIHKIFMPFLLSFYVLVGFKIFREKRISFTVLSFLIWYFMLWVSVIIPGKYFAHYFIQFFPLLSLACPFIFDHTKIKELKYKSGLFALILFFSVLILNYRNYKRYIAAHDYPREIAEYIQRRIDKEDQIFIGNNYHIIYYFLNKEVPLKYVHPSVLIKKDHIKTLKLNPKDEIKKIINTKPKYILIEGKFPVDILNEFITREYVHIKTFNTNIHLYHRT